MLHKFWALANVAAHISHVHDVATLTFEMYIAQTITNTAQVYCTTVPSCFA